MPHIRTEKWYPLFLNMLKPVKCRIFAPKKWYPLFLNMLYCPNKVLLVLLASAANSVRVASNVPLRPPLRRRCWRSSRRFCRCPSEICSATGSGSGGAGALGDDPKHIGFLP
jgi:hypothetical protein